MTRALSDKPLVNIHLLPKQIRNAPCLFKSVQMLSALVTLFTSVMITHIVFSLGVLGEQERRVMYVELCRLSEEEALEVICPVSTLFPLVYYSFVWVSAVSTAVFCALLLRWQWKVNFLQDSKCCR